MTTLPSPPLSPVDAPPYTSPKLMTTPTGRGYRKEHHRHPERRRDTFELLQALVIEHQRLEQQEYETLLREAPSISCRTPTKPPKGILINSSSRNNDNMTNAQQSTPYSPSTKTTKKAEVTSKSSPPSPRDKGHSCPTIPPPPTSSIPTTGSSPPRSSLSRIAFALPPPIAPSSSSPSSSARAPPHSSSSSSPSPLSSSHSSPITTTSPSRTPRHSVVRFSTGPPKIYRYPKLPGHQEI